MAPIYSDKGNWLLLRTNPKWMKVDIWFVVTGGVEPEETDEQAVIREIKEETQLKILDIKSTSYSCTYEYPPGSKEMNKEKAFIVKVEESKPKLSGEHLEYKWLSKEEFLNQIDWDENIDSKDKLKELIK